MIAAIAASAPIRVLLIEDNPGDARLIVEMLRDVSSDLFVVDRVTCLMDAVEYLDYGSPDVVILDLGLPDSSGLETFQRARAVGNDKPIVIISGLDDERLAMEAVRAGAQDYLVKGQINGEGVARVIRYGIERKYAEQALRYERDRAQRYLDTAEVMLIALDGEARITLVNRYACSMLGWTAHELIGRSFWALLPERLRDAHRELFSDVMAGHVPSSGATVVTRSGEERLVEWRHTVLRNEAGEAVGTFSSGTDITDRNRSIEALRITEERMRFALQHANVGVWDMDYLTGVLRWSEQLEAQYGMAPGTFPGTFEAFVERIHVDDRESVLDAIAKAMKGGTDFVIEHRVIGLTGKIRWLSGAGRVLLDDRGQPVRGVGISQDVTERHILEEQFQQAQKMEAVGRLAGGVAHDFNNLLTAILGYCELALLDLPKDDWRRADIAQIQLAGVQAAGLTRQLLAFSRKQIIEPTILDLNAIITELRPLLGRVIGEDVTIAVRLAPDLARVRADRGQMEQLIMNLAVNARDAMPTGGRLTLQTANTELDEEYAATHLAVTSGPHVVLTVSDTGSGMTPEVQARLFEPFFTTKPVGKGTGLGLATVHGVVMRSGGSVGVYSEVGKGTSFNVYLPVADPTEFVQLAPAGVAGSGTGAETVLVVEDADGLRELTKRLLERKGYTVLVAANADEAVELFARHPSISVLLTDVVMPGASGPELTRQLLEEHPELKVVYMSGYTEDAIVHHGVLEAGIAFLHKPFTSDALARKIREVLDR
jgi:two-component system cell cycle sensor histidine kinase/response regulator CckA